MPVLVNGNPLPPIRLIRIIDCYGRRWCVPSAQMAEPDRAMLALYRRDGKRATERPTVAAAQQLGIGRDPSPMMIHRDNITKCTGESTRLAAPH